MYAGADLLGSSVSQMVASDQRTSWCDPSFTAMSFFSRTVGAQSGELELRATDDCTLVVAIENRGLIFDDELFDPPGGVAIIRFPAGLENEPEVKILNFTKFNDQ